MEQDFGKEEQDCKDGSGLQLISGQDVPEIKATILVKFWTLYWSLFLLVDISLLSPLFPSSRNFFLLLQDTKEQF